MTEHEAWEFLDWWVKSIISYQKYDPTFNPNEMIIKLCAAIGITLERVQKLEVENGKLKVDSIK